MRSPIAYMPLNTYPETSADAALLAAIGFVAANGWGLHVSTFAVEIPQVTSPLSGVLIDIPGLVNAAEDRSKAECQRLHGVIAGASGPQFAPQIMTQMMVLGGAPDTAATEARYFDLTVLPWVADSAAALDMAQAIVFGSGRPAILVPPSAPAGPVDHIAIAWDESHVAARALNDALPLLAPGGRISVLTVRGEKALSEEDLAQTLAVSLDLRGFRATALDIEIGGRTVSQALQDAARAEGASLLVMGGFGHSRLRDFILGGATRGIFKDLQLPTLLSH